MKDALLNMNIITINNKYSVTVSEILLNLSDLKYIENYHISSYKTVMENIKYLSSKSPSLNYMFVILSLEEEFYVYKYLKKNN